MSEIKRILQKIREGKLKKLLAELAWMYLHVRRYWLLVGAFVLLGASGSVLGLGTAVVSKHLIDAVTGQSSGSIGWAAALYGGVGISQILISAVRNRLSLKIRLKVNTEIRADIYEKILRTDWASLEHYKTGDFLYRINGDAGMVTNGVLTFLPAVVNTAINFLGAFLIIVREDRAMAALALVGAPISFFSSRYMTRKMRDMQKEEAELSSDRMSFDQEIFQNLQFIKAFHMIDPVLEKMNALQQKAVDFSLLHNQFQSAAMVITSLTGQLVGYACYGFAVYRLWRGEISYGTMTMFVSMAGSLRSAFSGMLQLVPTALRIGVSAGRVMEMVSLPRENLDHEEEAEEILQESREEGVYVHMEGVDFRYGPEEDWVYQEADFRAEPGEIVALIGPSGQGKTTTLRLLLGLFAPEKGRVQVGNPRGEGLPASSSTRRLFSYIPQENTLFSGTIAENMRMARPEATDGEIEEALKAACAWEFVKELEQGIHTQVRERGRRFSEGQKQRLSIARALLADAPVMILDEATSALDVGTERRVLRSIIKKEDRRTVIVAAHRPSVFALCSRVYKIEDHRMSEVDEKGLMDFLDRF